MLELLNSAGWLQFIGNRNVHNIDDAGNYIQAILDNRNYFYSVFEHRETGKPIGIITFLFREHQEYPDIGFAMLPEFENKGYAFEAVKKYMDEILKNKMQTKICAITMPENQKSIALLLKLGMRFSHLKTENGESLSVYLL